MAIDDNKSYELTGLQVKDLAQKVKAKADSTSLAPVATSGDYDDLQNKPTIPSYSDFTGATSSTAGAHGLVPAPAAGDQTKYLSGDGSWSVPSGTSYTAGANIQISAQNEISATDTTYSNFTGATSSADGSAGLVPQPLIADKDKYLKGDGTWTEPVAKLVEMSYGESNAWTKFINAYSAGSIVYCRASSNANPGSGAKTRKAFMAYVNNEDNPTSVEFQYVRSVSSKSDSQQTDQVFVYTLTNASGGTWSVASRNMGPKINVDSSLTKTFTSGANATVTLKANAMTGATSSTAGSAGYVPAPAAGDEGKVLQGDGTWVTPTDTTYSAGANVQISAQNVISATDTTYSDMVGADSATPGAAGLVPAPAAGDEAKVLSGAALWVSQPTVNDATLTIQRNGTNVDTFTANASTNKTIDIDVHNGVMTAWNLVPSADTTAGWRALFPTDGVYVTFYDGNGSFTNKPSGWGVLTTKISYQINSTTNFEIYQSWNSSGGGISCTRRGNTIGWYGNANDSGSFTTIEDGLSVGWHPFAVTSVSQATQTGYLPGRNTFTYGGSGQGGILMSDMPSGVKMYRVKSVLTLNSTVTSKNFGISNLKASTTAYTRWSGILNGTTKAWAQASNSTGTGNFANLTGDAVQINGASIEYTAFRGVTTGGEWSITGKINIGGQNSVIDFMTVCTAKDATSPPYIYLRGIIASDVSSFMGSLEVFL